ncbi:uncharacterized protein LOC141628579 [Silene latifolia]|uniref:uncharacterized protein LOC141628579 n=1 Tax=Silene latifolia TaxID=37657 RepID=UPI003D774B04
MVGLLGFVTTSASPEVRRLSTADMVLDEVGMENFLNERIGTRHHFITGKDFKDLKEMKKEVEKVGHENNIHIIKYMFNAKRGLQIYACDRSGTYRPPKRKVRTYSNKFTGTRKINCPFRLRALRQDAGTWKLFVRCGFHNHELDDNPFGHAKVGKVDQATKEKILNLSKIHVSVGDILTNVGDNELTPRQVYNICQREKSKSRENRTESEQLLMLLSENGYQHWFQTIPVNEGGKRRELTDIIFCAPGSLDMLHQRHIEKDVEAWVKGVTGRGYMGEFSKRRWGTMVNSLTEEDFVNNEKPMYEPLSTVGGFEHYFKETWINQYKETFVSAWTNKVLHFGNVTTNLTGKYIELNSIHPFWRTLDYKKKDSIDDTLSQEQKSFRRLSDGLLKCEPEKIKRCCDAMEDIIRPSNIVESMGPSKPPFLYPSSVLNVIDSITDWYDPKPDGNYGFRVISRQLYSDENEWVRVRRELLGELMKNSHKYANTFGSEERIDAIAYLLSHWEGSAPDDK